VDSDAPALHPRLVPIADLNLDPKNARLHSERNLSAIGYSLSKFRQRKAIVVNRRTMTVEAGNGTITAALELGADHIVAVFVDDEDADAAEYAHIDNRTADLAEWDPDQLAANIGEFPDLDWSAGGWEPADFEDFEVNAVAPATRHASWRDGARIVRRQRDHARRGRWARLQGHRGRDGSRVL
jgi:hypothetical protein